MLGRKREGKKAPACIHNFQSLVERKFNRKIVCMQTDWGGEYEKLNSFFQKIGISHKVSCPHAHQQNGAAERKHRHIVEVGLALLANSSMPLKFGMKLSSQQLISLIFFLVRSLIIKPLLRSYSLRSLTIILCTSFGCAVWPNLRPYNSRKLAFRSTRCVFRLQLHARGL